MSSPKKFIPHYTLEDYRQWEGAWELIDGIPIAMTPSPFGPHERIVSRLSFEIQSQLRSYGCLCEVYTNLDWIITEDTVVRPDLMVVCGEQPQRHLESPPALLCEVLSDATRGQDLTAKRSLYMENRVPHYLIIDPAAKSLEHVSGTDNRQLASSDQLELVFPCQIDCEIGIACWRLFD